MFALRTLIAAGLLAAAGLSTGCQWVPRNQLAAIQAQNRALSEEKKALLAENQNLKSLREKFIDQQADMEQQLAQLDAQVGLESRRVANFRNERDAIKDLIHGGSRVPSGFSGQLAELARRYPQLQFDPQTGISKLDTDVMFDDGQAELKPESERLLKEFARLLQAPEARELKIMIVGHTDNRLMAKRPARDEYPTNWHLSTARSLAVAEYLRKSGLPDNRMGVTAFAQHQPLTPNATAADRQRNRRVEIFVTGPETPIVGWVETTPNLY